MGRLRAAGIGVRLFARRPEVVARFAHLGAVIERSAAALASVRHRGRSRHCVLDAIAFSKCWGVAANAMDRVPATVGAAAR